MTRKQLFKELRAISKLYGMKVNFRSNLKIGKLEVSGYANSDGSFVVGSDMNMKTIISIFFHEMAHEFDNAEGIYSRYYERTTKSFLYCLKAEIHTDKRGEIMSKLWYPHIRYERCYRNKKG